MDTKVIMLGCGTPNACFNASGPAIAITVDNQCYLFDCGPGVVRQITRMYHKKENALYLPNITKLFITHLHSDHTLGLSDMMLTPWVLERTKPLDVYGPKGISNMCEHLLKAYEQDIQFRIHGFEKANETGIQIQPHEIQEGIIYQDNNIKVEAFLVSHGQWESYAYKCITKDKTIVLSGDTCPVEKMIEKAKDCDILIHEVFYSKGLASRDAKWQNYHSHVHTGAIELGKLAQQAKPKVLVTYHRLYHMNMLDNTIDIENEMNKRDQLIKQEISQNFQGEIIMAHDFDII